MKRLTKLAPAAARAAPPKISELLREQIPLRDMSDCLLAVYDEVSRRAFQRCIVRGAQAHANREDWKGAEDDLFARIAVDFEESGANLYALASLPGCAGAEITVAVDECWLLISGYGDLPAPSDASESFSDYLPEDFGADSAGDAGEESSVGPEAIRSHDGSEPQGWNAPSESPPARTDDDSGGHRDAGLYSPRPFCVVALRTKVDPGRSVAVLCDGLLAVRMGKAPLINPVPRVA
jgi:HSP20 family molecular chaperone IbpA